MNPTGFGAELTKELYSGKICAGVVGGGAAVEGFFEDFEDSLDELDCSFEDTEVPPFIVVESQEGVSLRIFFLRSDSPRSTEGLRLSSGGRCGCCEST